MIQIYCGDGKGKTTAAVGQAVRAAGHGFYVIFAQFLKNDSSGEISILKGLSGIQVIHTAVFYGFVKDMNIEQRAEMKIQCTGLLQQIEEKLWMKQGENRLVVLDEVLHACNKELLEEQRLCEFLDACPEKTEVVLTGRNPSAALMERADYISEIHKIKHPYDRGITARKGIEL